MLRQAQHELGYSQHSEPFTLSLSKGGL